MPIRHTKKGWYWGSQGPFPTREKAMEVMRAIYHERGTKDEHPAMTRHKAQH